jgi:hypothetical protein
MKKLGAILILLGVGLFMFSVFSWSIGPMPTYDTGAKLGIAIGATLAVGGSLLYRQKRP